MTHISFKSGIFSLIWELSAGYLLYNMNSLLHDKSWAFIALFEVHQTSAVLISARTQYACNINARCQGSKKLSSYKLFQQKNWHLIFVLQIDRSILLQILSHIFKRLLAYNTLLSVHKTNALLTCAVSTQHHGVTTSLKLFIIIRLPFSNLKMEAPFLIQERKHILLDQRDRLHYHN